MSILLPMTWMTENTIIRCTHVLCMYLFIKFSSIFINNQSHLWLMTIKILSMTLSKTTFEIPKTAESYMIGKIGINVLCHTLILLSKISLDRNCDVTLMVGTLTSNRYQLFSLCHWNYSCCSSNKVTLM